MALVKGTNSYATVAEATAYFEDRLDVEVWTAASADRKAQALITATAYLDDLRWTGYAVSDSQPLAFPRVGEYFDPRAGTDVILDSTVPLRVVTATYELAYHLLNNTNLLDDTGTVKDLTVGTISLTMIRAPSKIPSSVRRLIAPLLENRGVNTWWRAN